MSVIILPSLSMPGLRDGGRKGGKKEGMREKKREGGRVGGREKKGKKRGRKWGKVGGRGNYKKKLCLTVYRMLFSIKTCSITLSCTCSARALS